MVRPLQEAEDLILEPKRAGAVLVGMAGSAAWRQQANTVLTQPGPHVSADPARLQQVFWNLLRNAIKFTPRGGCVGVRCRHDGDGHVVAEVIDSGAGIEPAVLPLIFTAFEQGGAKVTRQFGGLGLGLAITKGLVEMHGGASRPTAKAKAMGRRCG